MQIAHMPIWPPDADASDPPVRTPDVFGADTQPKVDAQGAEMVGPWVDPDVTGRPVQQTVGAASRHCHVKQQLEQDVTSRARAHLPSPRRNKRAGQPVGEETLEGR